MKNDYEDVLKVGWAEKCLILLDEKGILKGSVSSWLVYDRTVRLGSVSAENRDFTEISVRFGSVKFSAENRDFTENSVRFGSLKFSAEQKPNNLVHFRRFLANLVTFMNYFLTKHCSISILSLILANPRQGISKFSAVNLKPNM